MALLARELRKRVRKWRIPFISLGAFNARLAIAIAAISAAYEVFNCSSHYETFRDLDVPTINILTGRSL